MKTPRKRVLKIFLKRVTSYQIKKIFFLKQLVSSANRNGFTEEGRSLTKIMNKSGPKSTSMRDARDKRERVRNATIK